MADELFDPDWCVAPSTTLSKWLFEHNVTPGELAERGGSGQWPDNVHAALLIRDVLTERPLTTDHAGILGQATEIPAHFWLAREHDYREGLAAGNTDTTHHVGYPTGTTHLDQVITWGACPRCLIAYEPHIVWQHNLAGADVIERRCPHCGVSPDVP